MASADNKGVIKYWQKSMNMVKEYQGHEDVIRGLSFSPTDDKLASAADDARYCLATRTRSITLKTVVSIYIKVMLE